MEGDETPPKLIIIMRIFQKKKYEINRFRENQFNSFITGHEIT